MDVKHMDSKRHQEATGCPNNRILINARNLALTTKPIIFHTPVIPSFNDTEEEILEIATFVRSLIDLRKQTHHIQNDEHCGISLELLRFHQMAKDKYNSLGIEFISGDLMPPSIEEMSKLVKIVQSCNVPSFNKWAG
jgi:pyruvate formate lyase activating enzyme